MRCKACDKALSDTESVRKDPQTGEYYDLCGTCYSASEQAVDELGDLGNFSQIVIDEDTY